MALKYFGTDGIRGPIKDRMTPEFMKRVGRGLGRYLRERHPDGEVHLIVGRDTRASGDALEKALLDGLAPYGISVDCLGVIPTPAVSYWIDELEADNGVMITASHNPATDNGIKFFNAHGRKQTPEREERIEQLMDEKLPSPEERKEGEIIYHDDGEESYVEHLFQIVPKGRFAGWRVVLDTANGATAMTSAIYLKALGAELIQIGAKPDGYNINDGVGSEYPEVMAKQVVQSGAHLGIAHDGDGDRVVMCDEEGAIVPGDQLLGILALDALRHNALKKKTLVTTIQSNLGLDKAVKAAGGEVVRVDVGDRNVLYKLIEIDGNLGGEPTGHILLKDHAKSADGIIVAVKVMEIMSQREKRLADLRSEIPLLPQVTADLAIKEKKAWEKLLALREAIKEVEANVEGSGGRVLARYSGTESKVPLLVEGEDEEMIKKGLDQLKQAAKKDLEVIV